MRTKALASMFLLVAACGDDGGDYQPPGGTVDAPGGTVDAAVDAAPADSPGDGGGGDGGGGLGGPTVITLVDPLAGDLISGVKTLEVKVEDPDGIVTVTASIGGMTAVAMNQVGMSPMYKGQLNTIPLAGLVAPTIVVRAVDTGGNQAQLGFEVVLDNQPPVSSLDTANVRTVKLEGTDELCSIDFDPLGDDAPNDADAVPQLIELRARVRDVPNSGTLNSTLSIPKGGVETVHLFVFDDTTKPLVVDTNGDGVCDAINPTIVPTTTPMFSNEAATLLLTHLDPAGEGVFGPDTFGGANAGACTAGTQTDTGTPVCLGESSTTVILKEPFQTTSEIFGIPPADDSNCMGFAFDARAANISDGWACAATLAIDTLGNRSVSAPLRICVDSDGNQDNGCAAWGNPSANPPNCTGTFTGGVVNNTPCVAREFYRSSTPNEFELVDP